MLRRHLHEICVQNLNHITYLILHNSNRHRLIPKDNSTVAEDRNRGVDHVIVGCSLLIEREQVLLDGVVTQLAWTTCLRVQSFGVREARAGGECKVQTDKHCDFLPKEGWARFAEVLWDQ